MMKHNFTQTCSDYPLRNTKLYQLLSDIDPIFRRLVLLPTQLKQYLTDWLS